MSKKRPPPAAPAKTGSSWKEKAAKGEAAIATLLNILNEESITVIDFLTDKMKEFNSGYLVTGDGKDWPGTPHGCLADVDLVDAVQHIFEQRLEDIRERDKD